MRFARRDYIRHLAIKYESRLVADLVRLGGPGTKGLKSFGTHHCLHGNRAALEWKLQLFVDEMIIKACLRCIGGRSRKVHSAWARPVDRSQAHGTRLAACVDIAVTQLEAPQPAARLANRRDLSVRCRIVRRRN